MLFYLPLPFLFLAAAFVSLWIKREPKIWGTLFCLSVLAGVINGYIYWTGFLILIGSTLLWFSFYQKLSITVFFILVCIGMSLKLHLLTGFIPHSITKKFAIGLENPLFGFFPLALLIPLAHGIKEWKSVFKGLIIGCLGIGIMVALAMISQVVTFDFHTPSHLFLRLTSNLIFTCIPEEAFFRGFIQKNFSEYFKKLWIGNGLALILTSFLFAGSHYYWSPNLGILAFTFIAGLLYGSVYLYSKKIESSIFCHFLLNFVHMTFFSYHAN